MNPLEIYPSRWKNFFQAFASLAFTAGSILVIRTDDEKPFIGWIGLLFFGSGCIFFLKKLLDRQPEFVLDDDGIEVKTNRRTKIFWDEISSFDIFFLPPHGPQMLNLTLTQAGAERVFGQQVSESKYQKWMVKKLGIGYRITVPAGGLAISKQQFLEEIGQRHSACHSR